MIESVFSICRPANAP